MAINPYFDTYNVASEQRLIEDLIIEAVKQYGFDIYYIPKTVNNLDKIIGEDNILSFEQASSLEMYVKDFQGFTGDGSFLSKFGIEIRQTMTFTFSRRRFQEIRTLNYEDENGFEYMNEDTNLYQAMDTDPIQMEDGNSGSFFIQSLRPEMGDMLYFPMVGKWFQIKYVRTDEVNFFQMGKLQMYEVDVELFEYSGEKVTTGITEVDAISQYDSSTLSFNYQLDDDSVITDESGENAPYTNESYSIESTDPIADNNNLKVETSDIVDFSEVNPFIRVDSQGRW